MFRKMIALFAAFSLMICFFPNIGIQAASDFKIERDELGNSFVAGYVGKNENIVIPQNVDYIAENAFEENLTIRSVIIPAGCKTVEKGAFEKCINLISVVFQGDVSIEDSAFCDCTSLKEVIFNKRNADASLGNNAFKNCFSLSSINLPENTSKISGFAFGNCTSLKSLTIPPDALLSDRAVGFMYDEKSGKYFVADGKSEVYIIYFRLYNGVLIEWYAPKTANTVMLNVMKNSDGQRYAKSMGIDFTVYEEFAAPGILSSSTKNSVTLNWSKVKGADAYRVYINDGSGYKEYKTSSSAMCRVDNLKSDTEYKFKVVTLVNIKQKNYSEISTSDEISVKTAAESAANLKKTDVPDAPKVSVSADSSSIRLSWKKVDGADAYRIYMFDKEKNKYVKYRTTTRIRLNIENLKAGEEYRLRVVSLYSNNGGSEKYVESESTEEIVVTLKNDAK